MSLYYALKKELTVMFRNPQILVSIVIVPILFVSLGGALRGALQTAEQIYVEIVKQGIPVRILDSDPLTYEILSVVNQSSPFLAIPVTGENADEVLKQRGILVIIPEGFAESIRTRRAASINASVTAGSLSFGEVTGKQGVVNSFASALADAAKRIVAARYNLSLEELSISVGSAVDVSISGKVVKFEDLGRLITTLTTVVYILSLIGALAFQYGALSMAQEKEEKTLELISVLPVPRSVIGLAKTISVVILAVVESSVFIASYIYYMNTVAPATGELLAPLTSSPSATATLAGTVFLAASVMAVLGLALGAFVRDARTAGIIATPVIMVAIFGALAFQFVGIPVDMTSLISLSASAVLAPIASIIIASFYGAPNTLYVVAVLAGEFALALLLLGRALNSEKMFTGFGLTSRLRRSTSR